MSDEGGRWGRFFRGSRRFCFGCSSCSRKSFDEEHEPKMEECDEDILTGRPLEQQHSHQPQIHQPQKRPQQKPSPHLLPLIQGKMEGGDSPSFIESSRDGKQSDSAFLPSRFGGRETYGVRWSVQKKVRRCSLEERVPSFILPHSYLSCDLLDIHYLEQAQRLLSNVNKWNFNIFVLDWLTNGRSFYYLVMHLFHEYNFLEIFKLDVVLVLRALRLVEVGYCRRNPYHNSLHAADVVQAIHCNMLEDCIAPYLTPIEKMAAIMAAACHDLDHPGVNQSFLIASSHHLAPLYDGVSVLENHHWRSTVSIVRESHLFDNLSQTQWNRLRYLLEVLILATDISKQQDILLKFREYINTHSLDLASNEEHRNFILQITLKCADICNPCRAWKVSRKWSQLICEEFFRQGDKEKGLNLPVTISFDRVQSTTAKIQAGFMSFVVEPLFLEWDKFAPSNRSKTMLNNLNRNRSKWSEISQGEFLCEGDEDQKKSSASTIVSFLDWDEDENNNNDDGDDDDDDGDDDDDKNLLLASSTNGKNVLNVSRRPSDSSRKLGSRKSSLSSVGLKFKLKASGLSAEKENFNPSIKSTRGSEIFSSSKCSLSSSNAPQSKSGENRRLSLPVSKQGNQGLQALNHRRASLPLTRILEIGSSNLSVGCHSSRGGWSLMINTSSGQLESLSELSPSVDEGRDSKTADRAKCGKEPESGKKYERLKCKFSFDSGGHPPAGTRANMERSESFSTACYKKHKKYQQKIYHHYSEMVLSICPNRWFESKKRRSSCPLADTKATFNNNNVGGCPSSNYNCYSDADEGCCSGKPTSKLQSSLGKRGMLMALGEDCDAPGESMTMIPELKPRDVNPHPMLPGRNRRIASLTEDIDWPKSRPSKKRAKSLVTSSLAEDGSVICRTHLLRETEDGATDCRDDATSRGGPSNTAMGKPLKKNVFIALQSSSKEILSKLTSSGATSPRNSGLKSLPQRSSRSPFTSSPAILRFVDGRLRPPKSASKRTSSESCSQDGEIVPLLSKS